MLITKMIGYPKRIKMFPILTTTNQTNIILNHHLNTHQNTNITANIVNKPQIWSMSSRLIPTPTQPQSIPHTPYYHHTTISYHCQVFSGKSSLPISLMLRPLDPKSSGNPDLDDLPILKSTRLCAGVSGCMAWVWASSSMTAL